MPAGCGADHFKTRSDAAFTTSLITTSDRAGDRNIEMDSRSDVMNLSMFGGVGKDA